MSTESSKVSKKKVGKEESKEKLSYPGWKEMKVGDKVQVTVRGEIIVTSKFTLPHPSMVVRTSSGVKTFYPDHDIAEVALITTE